MRFDDLPEDMQVFLRDTLEQLDVDVDSVLLPSSKIIVEKVLVASLPYFTEKEMCRDRGVPHAIAMDKEALEIPIILNGSRLVDGHHRTYRARLDGVVFLPAIHISQFFTP